MAREYGPRNETFGDKLLGVAGGPWGKAGVLGLGALGSMVGIHNAPSSIDLSQKRFDFLMRGMNRIPGLADQFRKYLMRGSGGEQANLLGGVEQFRSGFQKSMLDRGLGRTALAGMGESMSRSMAGRGMADLYGRYNMAGFGAANQNIVQMLMAALTEDDMKNRMIGAGVGAAGNVLDRVLFPRSA